MVEELRCRGRPIDQNFANEDCLYLRFLRSECNQERLIKVKFPYTSTNWSKYCHDPRWVVVDGLTKWGVLSLSCEILLNVVIVLPLHGLAYVFRPSHVPVCECGPLRPESGKPENYSHVEICPICVPIGTQKPVSSALAENFEQMNSTIDFVDEIKESLKTSIPLCKAPIDRLPEERLAPLKVEFREQISSMLSEEMIKKECDPPRMWGF